MGISGIIYFLTPINDTNANGNKRIKHTQSRK